MRKETRGGYLITLVKQTGARVFEKILDEAGIEEFNGAQGRLLYVLWQSDGISATNLAREAGLAKTTLTSMLDRMESADLLKRVPAPNDRRTTLIRLTQKARDLRGKYDEVSDEMNEIYFRGFGDSEIEAFEHSLERILKNLDDYKANSEAQS